LKREIEEETEVYYRLVTICLRNRGLFS